MVVRVENIYVRGGEYFAVDARADWASFPIELTSTNAAKLSKYGKYSATSSYSKAEIEKLVVYAYNRGVRILPEIDTPGHSYSWRAGYPEVVTECPNTVSLHGGGGQAALDPSTNRTYDVVAALLGEMGGVFGASKQFEFMKVCSPDAFRYCSVQIQTRV